MSLGGCVLAKWLTLLLLALPMAASCAVRQIPLIPALEPLVSAETPRTTGKVVAFVMDERVAGFRNERDFSLTQAERYDSGQHFTRSLLFQLRARGVQVLEVTTEEEGQRLGAPYVLIPDAPGLTVIRPKGLFDMSFLGSLNRINVSYSVRMLKNGARVPQRVSGSGSRTASFFWSNAALQTAGLFMLGVSVSLVFYGAWFASIVATNWQTLDQARRSGELSPLEQLSLVTPPPSVAIVVFVADTIVSQLTAQVVPRVVNPLVDILVNEPRWESMVQAAHDDAAAALADQLTLRLGGLRPAVETP
jgi:hypothetical protein